MWSAEREKKNQDVKTFSSYHGRRGFGHSLAYEQLCPLSQYFGIFIHFITGYKQGYKQVFAKVLNIQM